MHKQNEMLWWRPVLLVRHSTARSLLCDVEGRAGDADCGNVGRRARRSVGQSTTKSKASPMKNGGMQLKRRELPGQDVHPVRACNVVKCVVLLLVRGVVR
jgi:hypothetical protein